MLRSRQLRERNEALRARCKASVVAALECCEVSWSLQRPGDPVPSGATFALRARVGGEPALACWRRGTLLAHPRLLERARLVIGLGETFQADVGNLTVLAGLESPLPAALTLLRAADEVVAFELRLGGLGAVVPVESAPEQGGHVGA